MTDPTRKEQVRDALEIAESGLIKAVLDVRRLSRRSSVESVQARRRASEWAGVVDTLWEVLRRS